MKVTEGQGFSPITIVLETPEEAAYMWYCLNATENGPIKLMRKDGFFDCLIGANLWDKYNVVFDRRKAMAALKKC